jgi:hypothetical protein
LIPTMPQNPIQQDACGLIPSNGYACAPIEVPVRNLWAPSSRL